MLNGRLPYRDFYMEYPPGAAPFFLAPTALRGPDNYNLTFKFFATAAGIGILVAVACVLVLLRAGRLRSGVALGLVAVMPIALGAVVSTGTTCGRCSSSRSPCFPGGSARPARFRTSGGGRRGQDLPCGAALGRGAPRPAHERAWALVGALGTFAAVSLALTLPLAALAPGGFGFSVKTQVIRQLQLESLAASILLAADKVGIYSARIVAGKPGSLDLGGTVPDLLGVVTTLLWSLR